MRAPARDPGNSGAGRSSRRSSPATPPATPPSATPGADPTTIASAERAGAGQRGAAGRVRRHRRRVPPGPLRRRHHRRRVGLCQMSEDERWGRVVARGGRRLTIRPAVRRRAARRGHHHRRSRARPRDLGAGCADRRATAPGRGHRRHHRQGHRSHRPLRRPAGQAGGARLDRVRGAGVLGRAGGGGCGSSSSRGSAPTPGPGHRPGPAGCCRCSRLDGDLPGGSQEAGSDSIRRWDSRAPGRTTLLSGAVGLAAVGPDEAHRHPRHRHRRRGLPPNSWARLDRWPRCPDRRPAAARWGGSSRWGPPRTWTWRRGRDVAGASTSTVTTATCR